MTRWEIDVPMTVPTGIGEHRPFSSNDRGHWAGKADHTAKIRHAVAWRAKAQRVPAQHHITVQLHYAPGDHRRRDASNLMATQKPAVDGLVDAGIVPDDTAQWVTELMPVIHGGTACPSWPRRLWLVVEASARPAELIIQEEPHA